MLHSAGNQLPHINLDLACSWDVFAASWGADHGHDQATDHPVLCLLKFIPFNWWLDTIIDNAKWEDINGHTPSSRGVFPIWCLPVPVYFYLDSAWFSHLIAGIEKIKVCPWKKAWDKLLDPYSVAILSAI